MSSKQKFKRYSPKKSYLIISVLLVAIIFIVLYFYTDLHLYFTWLISISLVTFIFYGYDKFMAIYKYSRIPEIIFYILLLSGGFLGGFVGMIAFHHKKRKIVFLIIMMLSAVIHLYIYQYLFN